jgi:hypothetical protein
VGTGEVTNPAGWITAHAKLLLQFGDWEPSPIVGEPLSGIKKSRFSRRPAMTMRCCGAARGQIKSRRIKKKCVAKPEEHRGNALVALPEPLAYNPFQDRYGKLKKSSA